MANIPKDIIDAFYLGNLPKGFDFKVNDNVVVLVGEHSGQNGYVISIESLEPVPKYLIELESGGDIIVDQSNLKLVSI